ncbi:MarR family winged helix-turn-helix transcriptional regulator [Paraburkholderia sp. BCC1886]|uniref:MarR family winged helix-turn-helix transcriptional regulator n=1 Tax=Paraburkholderia sp. BCC1886 TaxID=2562670 RepID=UPI00164282CB|nr:MarR family transcriptional regulator [Paraburkholderia sp. BCC1886]
MLKKNHPGTSRGSTGWASFIRTYVLVVDIMEETFRQEGLPPLSWYDVLWSLESSPEGRLRMRDLAEQAVYSRSFITRIITTLEKEGLVVRGQSESDGRGKIAIITEKGRALRKRMWPLYQRLIEQHFNSHLTPGEHDALERGFRRILSAAHEYKQYAGLAAENPEETDSDGRATRRRSRSRPAAQRGGQ